ncbi:MAG TPA: hypothetical protein VFA70_08140 [Dehalococcoidia bacterium]|jgi:hypothetical protein|nr:hypothetical protein [Dehalococcoidia bacterium]
MTTAALARRLARLEAATGNGTPHAHPLRLLLFDESEPPAAWLDEQAACRGCAVPRAGRLAVWPPERWEQL